MSQPSATQPDPLSPATSASSVVSIGSRPPSCRAKVYGRSGGTPDLSRRRTSRAAWRSTVADDCLPQGGERARLATRWRCPAGGEATHVSSDRLGDVGDVEMNLIEEVGGPLRLRSQGSVLCEQRLDVVSVVFGMQCDLRRNRVRSFRGDQQGSRPKLERPPPASLRAQAVVGPLRGDGRRRSGRPMRFRWPDRRT